MSTTYRAIIGKNFGDEGKGLLTNYFSSQNSSTLVVKHNGGAQAGHTVETGGKRFVFHELGAGSFQKAPTYWSATFHPDLYKLRQEIEDFCGISGFIPQIFADPASNITTIDDILLNMAAERARGAARHGSCGMGIYECSLRQKAGYGLTLGELMSTAETTLINKLKKIRHDYLPGRLQELSLTLGKCGEFGEMLQNQLILKNFVRTLLHNLPFVTIVEEPQKLFADFEQVLFESGQGLLLDEDCKEFMPHVSASRTGLANPCGLLASCGQKLDEVVYVSRTYVTRHGAGFLPHECRATDLGLSLPDKTNVPNEWQGILRYATHGSAADFVRYVQKDLNGQAIKCSLALTHLNETGGNILLESGSLPWQEFIKLPEITAVFQDIIISDNCETAYTGHNYRQL